MSTVETGGRGRRLRPWLPPVRRRARSSRGGDVRALQGVDAPGARDPALVAAEGRAVHAARCGHDPGDRQRRDRLRHPRSAFEDRIEIITYRDYVGVSSALLLFVALVAPDVMCPDRRQHVLPLMFARPLMGTDYVMAKVGAIGSILFAFSFLPQVVLFVGNMLVSDSALDYLTGHLDVLWKVPVAVVLLAVYYAVIGVAHRLAHRPPDRRRRGGDRAVPRHVDRVGHHRRRELRDARRLARRRSSTSWRCRCTCATSCSSVTSIRELAAQRSRQRRAVRRSSTYVVVLVVCAGVLLRRYRWVER